MPRYFTLDQANELLPELRNLLTRIQEIRRLTLERQEEIEALGEKAGGNGHSPMDELHEHYRSVERLSQDLKNQIEEVQALGCEIKDLDRGLVDFRSWRHGQEVYLCWMLGEGEIAYWHDLQAGFGGRMPIGG